MGVVTGKDGIGAGTTTLRGMSVTSEDRPWGSWHVIEDGQGYKVKRIVVHPGKRLSLQTHEHRSEHWVVIFGIATCTAYDELGPVARSSQALLVVPR